MSINWKSRFMTLAFARFLSDRALVPEDANYAFRSPRQNTGSQIASVATSRHQALHAARGRQSSIRTERSPLLAAPVHRSLG